MKQSHRQPTRTFIRSSRNLALQKWSHVLRITSSLITSFSFSLLPIDVDLSTMMKTLFLSSCLVLLLTGSCNAFSAPRSASKPSTTALNALTLYGHPGTRSPLVDWALIELGVEYEAGDLARNPHPFGQIPCLTTDDGSVLFESGAILQHLLYNHATTSAKPSITSWITWANASLDPICFLETPDGKVYDSGLRQPNKRIDRLDAILSQNEFLVGDSFSLADVAVSSYLLYALLFFPNIELGRWPHMTKYMQQCVERPAFRQAFGGSTQDRLVASLSKQNSNKLFGMF